MAGLFSQISQFAKLLFAGRFFLLFQKIVAKTVPSRWLQLKKSVYFDLAARSAPDLRVNTEADQSLTIYEGDETSVVRVVRV